MQTLTDVDYDHMTPLWDEVVVKIKAPEKKTKGGIIMPDTTLEVADHAMVMGVVVAMGPMAFQYTLNGTVDKMDVEVGDFVVFRPYSGDLRTSKSGDEGPKFRTMSSRSIVGVLKGGAEHE